MREIIAFPISAVATLDPIKAVRDVAATWADRAAVQVWDVNNGLRTWADWRANARAGRGSGDPLAPIRALNEGDGIVIAINYHLFLKSPQVRQGLLDGARTWGASLRRLVLIVPTGVEFPPEIARYVYLLDYRLPGEEQLAAVVRANARANGLDVNDGQVRALARMGRGLTVYEFGNALALSLAQHREMRVEVVADQKAQLVKKNAVLEWLRSPWRFEDIGGLGNAKAFLRRTVGHEMARGAMLLGVPGVGKTMLAQALANEVGLPALALQFSNVFGSLVGESERRLKSALEVIEALAPAIVVVDEIEKGLAGAQSSHRTDGGASARVLETFLTWLNDRPAGVYVVATSNDITKLPPEFTRSGRWDAIFFFDIPGRAERDQIAALYAAKYNVPLDPRPDEQGWTGAEIETAYRLAAILQTDAADAARYVAPLYRTMGEQIAQLREWAKGRCIPASIPETASDADAFGVRTILT